MDMETPPILPHQKDPKNLLLWSAVETTDKEITKGVEFGKRKFTAIDAYHQIKNATEIRGPYGHARGLRDVEITYTTASNITYVTLFAEFFYPAGGAVGKFPIANNWKMGDDALKKIMTNSISKSLSYLGFNADVFMGAFDDDLFSHNQTQADKDKKAAAKAAAAPAPVVEEPKPSHVSGEMIDREMARMSKDKYSCYLTPAEQELAFTSYKELKGKDLVDALVKHITPPTPAEEPTTPSPTPPVVAETPPPTEVPTVPTAEVVPTAAAPAEEVAPSTPPPAEAMPWEAGK